MTQLNPPLKKTPLYWLHTEIGARMMPFAGYAMPLQYDQGIKHEHLHCRTHAGLFDLSHMGQIRLSGEQATAVLESLVPSDLIDLKVGQQRYTVFTNSQGGILDDFMVTNLGDYLFLVVNAGSRQDDLIHLQSTIGMHCQIEPLPDWALLALQGPAAAEVMDTLVPETRRLSFMQGGSFEVQGYTCLINRCGYTGEDGFEISVPATYAEPLARLFLAYDKVQAIGLGARDTLRLEAGFCLYGRDLDTNTTPVEAGIAWVLSQKRDDYPGAKLIGQQLQAGSPKQRTGLILRGTKVPLREGRLILNQAEKTVGHITSGSFSPSLNKPIAMGYIKTQYINAELHVNIRNNRYIVELVDLPFVKHNYHRKN